MYVHTYTYLRLDLRPPENYYIWPKMASLSALTHGQFFPPVEIITFQSQ